ncbi:hypothetical protein N7475_002992 [Penicillium sp. IBT 31633x]|nr:hypothetical protein N7475_002992 [Penicillium sp. IBT 31633x]
MSDLKPKTGRLSLLGLIKEVFNWYPTSYPSEERKLLFKLDLSILIFACLCCKFMSPTALSGNPLKKNAHVVFVKY